MATLGDDALEIGERVIELSRNYSAWNALADPARRESFANVFANHSDFLDSSALAHFQSLTIIMYQILDKRSDVLSLQSLLDKARSGYPTLIDTADQRMRPHSEIFDRICAIRSKVYAHRDKRVGPEAVFHLAGLTSPAIGACVDVLRDIMDMLYASFVADYSPNQFWEEANLRGECTAADIDEMLKALSNKSLQRTRGGSSEEA